VIRIGLISDTHGYLDPSVAEHFRDCDEIWHAGDIGDVAVIEALEKIKPVVAVFGNIDDLVMRARFPEDVRLAREGVTLWMTHIGGRPPRFNPRVSKVLKENQPDVFICGHSHILRVAKEKTFNVLCVNPGAAGNHGFHTMRTILRMEIQDGRIHKMEAIELGKRGQ